MSVYPCYPHIEGKYFETGYINEGNGNEWHFVDITNPSCDGVNFVWTNAAGVSWSMTADYWGPQIEGFHVGEDCPYYESGHLYADVIFDDFNGQVQKILGPWDEPYTRIPEWNGAGNYLEMDYVGTENENEWHTVSITNPSGDAYNWVWSNAAGVEWNLTANYDDYGRLESFFPDPETCPYWPDHTLVWINYNDYEYVQSVNGPYEEPYTKLDPWQGGNGEFLEMNYIGGANENDWHYVTITNPSNDGLNFVWDNRAGVSWSLIAKYDETGMLNYFEVGQDCPYYESGHTEARVNYDWETYSLVSVDGPGGAYTYSGKNECGGVYVIHPNDFYSGWYQDGPVEWNGPHMMNENGAHLYWLDQGDSGFWQFDYRYQDGTLDYYDGGYMNVSGEWYDTPNNYDAWGYAEYYFDGAGDVTFIIMN